MGVCDLVWITEGSSNVFLIVDFSGKLRNRNEDVPAVLVVLEKVVDVLFDFKSIS